MKAGRVQDKVDGGFGSEKRGVAIAGRMEASGGFYDASVDNKKRKRKQNG